MTDFAVVGGGIAGASVAYWLRRFNPAAKIAIVERGGLASGASGRNAGFLLQGGAGNFFTELASFGEERLREIWRLTGENISLIASELDPGEIELDRCGSYFCAGSEEEMEQLRSLIPYLGRWSIGAEPVSAAALRERTGASGFAGAVFYPGNACVNPERLVQHIAGRGEITVLEHHEVLGLTSASDAVTLVTPLRDVVAGRAVFACNAYLPLLFPDLEALVRPVRAQMLSTSRASGRFLGAPLYSHDGYYYVRQQPDCRVLAGGARHLHVAAERGWRDETTLPVQADIESYLRRHFPWAEDLTVERRWAGIMGFSPDGVPVVEGLPGHPNALWLGGFSGHGMALGFVLGKLVAQKLSGLESRELAPFTAARFSGRKGTPPPHAK